MNDLSTGRLSPNDVPQPVSDAQPDDGQTRIEIYTDGSCIGNPGPGGYGIVTLRLDADGNVRRSRERNGSSTDITTNIRMELTAACVGLEQLGRPTGEPVTVFCDANLIPNAMTGWLAKWKANGWRAASGKPVENRDLWERLEMAAEGREVAFRWVRGHNGTEYNERADRLAYAGAREAERRGVTLSR